MTSDPTSFPIRLLPSEIRNKIYRELLCAFTTPPATATVGSAFETSFPPCPHNIDTAILRTNSTIYREAYDVLVKTNRFVRITSVRGVPLRPLVKSLMVPVVASKKRVVKAFKGYVLAVHLGCKEPVQVREGTYGGNAEEWVEPHDLMILHRDLDLFCRTLADADGHRPGLIVIMQLSVKVAPVLFDQPESRYAPSFTPFFTEATQKSLLAPFRAHLRGYTSVQITGHIEKALATTARKEIQQDRWSNPQTILSDFTAAKEAGTKLFQQRLLEPASLAWQDAALDIDKITGSTAWPKLIALGGQPFISKLAETYFLVRLNIAHVQIAHITENPAMLHLAAFMAEDSLHMAVRSMKMGYWMEGFKYRPEDRHLAKLRYRLALLARMQGLPGTAERALMYIDGALRLAPGDVSILRERERTVTWVSEAVQVD